MLIFDAHLDLAMNALNWDRDLDLPVAEIRERERGMTQKGRGRGTVSLPELRRADVGLCSATVIARTARPDSPASGSASQEISYAKAQGQLAYYRVLEGEGKVRMIADAESLKAQAEAWQRDAGGCPLGFVLSMEGADPIVWPEQVHGWYEDGLRIVSLSHYGRSAYASGTDTEGGLTERGIALLKEMASAGMVLDVTHLADDAFWEAMAHWEGPVLASHNNCRALVPGGRQFTDDQLKAVIERGGVIGAALDAWMLYPGWVKGETQPEVVGIDAVADHVARVCELAGRVDHAGIGSDLDGGYGAEQTPRDLDTIADLQKLEGPLRDRGLSDRDVEAVFHGNWIRFLNEAWS